MQLDRGDRRGAVPEVDHDGCGRRAAQPPALRPGQPAVHPAQPVGVGGAPGDGADRPLRCHVRQGMREPWPHLPAARWPGPGRLHRLSPVVSGRRSRSVRFLAVVLAAVAVLGLGVAGRPGLFDLRSSVVDVQPRLLQVAMQARGVITLGDGLTVSMYAAGLRVQRQDQLAFETVVQGSLVSAARAATWRGGARTAASTWTPTYDNVRIDSVEVVGARRDVPGRGVRRRAALAAADPDRDPGAAARRPAGHGARGRPGRGARRPAGADRRAAAAVARAQPA